MRRLEIPHPNQFSAGNVSFSSLASKIATTPSSRVDDLEQKTWKVIDPFETRHMAEDIVAAIHQGSLSADVPWDEMDGDAGT